MEIRWTSPLANFAASAASAAATTTDAQHFARPALEVLLMNISLVEGIAFAAADAVDGNTMVHRRHLALGHHGVARFSYPISDHVLYSIALSGWLAGLSSLTIVEKRLWLRRTKNICECRGGAWK
jgi:hypothetical protein